MSAHPSDTFLDPCGYEVFALAGPVAFLPGGPVPSIFLP